LTFGSDPEHFIRKSPLVDEMHGCDNLDPDEFEN